MLRHHLLSSTAWDGGSVWDLPIDSVAQAPTIEQMQQYEKAKTAKVRASFPSWSCNTGVKGSPGTLPPRFMIVAFV